MQSLGTKQLKPHKIYSVDLNSIKAELTLLSVDVAFTLTYLFKHKRGNFQVLEQPHRQLID